MERSVIESSHSGPVNDISVDDLGSRMATSSDDCTIQVWSIQDNGTPVHMTTLQGLEAPVLMTSWAPHSFPGSMLASACADGTVVVWSDTQSNHQWSRVYTKPVGCVPLCVRWGPAEHGLLFACALSNGKAMVFHGQQQQWQHTVIDAHSAVCTSLSWSPSLAPGAMMVMPLSAQHPNPQQASLFPPLRLVTAGSERGVYIWRFAVQDRHWVREELSTDLCTAHWQEVSWAPNNGLPFTYIAAGSADGLVVIWSQDGLDGKWKAVLLPQQEDRIGRLSWSHVGSFLLISCANGAASMWKEQSSGEWEQVSSLFSHAK